MEKVTTIIYNRTSTEEQNPENQLSACKSINKYGAYELIEDQSSAWKDSGREGFETLLNKIKRKEVSHLIVWDLDRVYRNRKKLIAFFELCNIYNCKIHSYRQQWLEQINDMPEPWNEIIHHFLLEVMGWLAQDESDQKSMRVRASMRKREDGKIISYKGNIWGRKDVGEKAIKDIINLYEQGKNYREICQEVYYWDRNNHKKNVSIGLVHKVLANFKEGKIANKTIS